MMIDLNDHHDLEVHIQELRRLDKYRKESAHLRHQGYKTLKEEQEFQEFISQFQFDVSLDQEKPWLVLEYLRLLKVLFNEPKTQLGQKKERVKINNITKYLTIENIAEHPISVKLATQAMQLLTIVQGAAFLKPTLLCWYWIIREIFTADSPDWNIGGARAGDEGHSSAYTTIACVDSLQSFAQSYEYTGKFFGKLGEIQKRLEQLNKIYLDLQLHDSIPLEKWREMEKKQILFSSQLDLLQYWQYFAISLEGSNPETINNPTPIDVYIKSISDKLPEAISEVKGNLDSVKKDVEDFRIKEREKFENTNDISSTDREYLKLIRSESAHQIAINIFNEAINLATDIEQDISDQNNQNNKWELLQKKCHRAAERVHQMLNCSVKIYLASVIDRELSNVTLGINQEWDARELICAATAYSSIIDNPDEDERLRLVIPQLCKVISQTGQFKIGKPYHTINKKDYSLWAANSIILSYFARLLQNTKYQIKWEIPKFMLFYFRATKVAESGWCNMLTSEPRHSEIGSTITAIEALTTINRMLDEQINNIVLEHFSVKRPNELNVTTLESLFYPDYGLSLAPNNIGHKSISEVLHRMRLHITELTLQHQDQDNLYSLILYGPPGTGKTTFIESLALTSKVSLVEITPSDIIKGGEALAEHRARIVFEALSLLTRVVILFDEFDPVLRRRNPDSKDLNIFSFLTPGMLPKLKKLHDNAKNRSVAYVLATNLIGTLDEAAIRPGRFDERLGIFPPDLLSRAGRFISQAKLAEKSFSSDSPFVKEVIKNTAGAGMSSLARKGWFIYSKYMREDTPLYQLFESEPNPDIVDWPEPEEELNLKGEGRAAQQEYNEWEWVDQWDEKLDDQTSLKDALDNYPTRED